MTFQESAKKIVQDNRKRKVAVADKEIKDKQEWDRRVQKLRDKQKESRG